MVINPYKDRVLEQWVFDAPNLGLIKEPFVCGADELLVKMANNQNVEHPESGFKVLFSDNPFPNYQFELQFHRPEHTGVWYKCPKLDDAKGWLCPATKLFFNGFPTNIYVAVSTSAPVEQTMSVDGGIDFESEIIYQDLPSLPLD